MTIDRETVIRLVKEVWSVVCITEADARRFERFAALVLEHERKQKDVDWICGQLGITNKESSDVSK